MRTRLTHVGLVGLLLILGALNLPIIEIWGLVKAA